MEVTTIRLVLFDEKTLKITIINCIQNMWYLNTLPQIITSQTQ